MPFVDHVAYQPAKGQAELAFLAEAPSDTERIKNRPLVGPAGRNFNRCLQMAGIDREEVAVLNVFDEQLPGNKLEAWGVPLKNASEEEIKLPRGGYLPPDKVWHFNRLAEELKAVNPKVIVTMGETALWAMTGQTGISKVRGSVMEATRIRPGVRFIPTFHPQYLSYMHSAYPVVVGDFRRALQEARGEFDVTSRELWLEPSLVDLDLFWDQYLRRADIISVDIETAQWQITCIGFAADRHRAITIPFVDFRKPDHSYWSTVEEEVKAWEWVQMILNSPNPKVFQNGTYDNFFLLRLGLSVTNWRYDTRLQSHARSPEEPKSLAYLASRYAKVGAWKLMGETEEEKRDA